MNGGFEEPALIGKNDFESVNFKLAGIGRLCAFGKEFFHPLIERIHILFCERVVERPLRHFVAHFFERRQGLPRDALGGRIGSDKRRVCFFQFRKFIFERIKRLRGYFFPVLHVIEPPMIVNRLFKLLVAGSDLVRHRGHAENIAQFRSNASRKNQ